jgi:hemoglobin
MTHSPIRFALPLVVAFTMFAGTLAAQDQAVPPPPSLYDRLGGVRSIAVVVDDFVERIWVNKVLNENPKNKEAIGIKKATLKYLATELVCQATGGPQKYSGRPLKDVHANLGITEKEWDAMTMDFQATLDTFKVPKAEQGELLAILASTKGDVVTVAAEMKK